MGAYDDATNSGFAFQLRDLWRWRERFADDHDKWRREVDADRRDLHHLVETVEELAKSFDGLRKTLIAFAFTIAGSAVVFALSILVATGKVGR